MCVGGGGGMGGGGGGARGECGGGSPSYCKFLKSPLLLDNAVDLVCFTFTLLFSYSSTDIVRSMIQNLNSSNNLTFSLPLFIYSLFISIGVYKANTFKCRI